MVNHQASDQAVIRAAQSGDADAVAALYQRHAPAIFRYLYMRVSNSAIAEGLTGEVFMQMVAALPRYVDHGLPVGAWLLGIAHARLVDYFGQNNYQQPEPMSETLVEEAGSTETTALRQVEARTLLALFGGLTEEQRLAIQLRFIEGHSLEITAGLMQKTRRAVKALQFRALRQLAGQIQAKT